MKHSNGTTADVFGIFYKDLYSSRKPNDKGSTFKAKLAKKDIHSIFIKEIDLALK